MRGSEALRAVGGLDTGGAVAPDSRLGALAEAVPDGTAGPDGPAGPVDLGVPWFVAVDRGLGVSGMCPRRRPGAERLGDGREPPTLTPEVAELIGPAAPLGPAAPAALGDW